MVDESLKILWVDDEPDTLVFELSELEDWGHQVTVAESLEDALGIIKVEKFDLILSDQQLFGTGYASETNINLWMGCLLLRAIRKNFAPLSTSHDYIQNLLSKLEKDDVLQKHENEDVYVAFFSGFSNREVIDEIKASSPRDQSITIYAKPIDEIILERVVKAAVNQKDRIVNKQ